MKTLTTIIIILMSGAAFATGNDQCDHPRFLERGCGYEGQDGKDGKDGADGKDGINGQDGRNGVDGRDGVDGQNGRDGIDGKDGRDGIDGRPGRDGVNGKDGVVPIEWINETRNWQRDWGRFTAATEAIQVHLPQEQTSRVTFGMSRVHGSTGLGVGYAYKNEDGVAFTVGLGTSHGQTVGKASVGFEFGGHKQMKIVMPAVVVEPEPEPEPVYEEIIEQQQIIAIDHNEDIQMVQMAQVDIDERVAALEAELRKPKPKPKPIVTKKQPKFTDEQRSAVLAYFED